MGMVLGWVAGLGYLQWHHSPGDEGGFTVLEKSGRLETRGDV